jgi:hypothetical protein
MTMWTRIPSHDWLGSGLPPEETVELTVQSTASDHFPRCRIVPGLPECTKLIVCDGYKVQEDPKHKNYNRVGVVKPEQVERYHTYMDNVCHIHPGDGCLHCLARVFTKKSSGARFTRPSHETEKIGCVITVSLFYERALLAEFSTCLAVRRPGNH